MSAAYPWEEVQELLRGDLQKKRYEHTLGVTYTACALAMCHGADLTQARIAGLLHDCAKCLPDEEKLALLEQEQLPVREIERAHPGLLHAGAGAVLARKKYQVTDEAVLEAIRLHTTGAPAMSLLAKIIYVADYIEPHRHRAPKLDELRALAFHDLDLCVCRIMEQTVTHLSEAQSDPTATDPRTATALSYYQELIAARAQTQTEL